MCAVFNVGFILLTSPSSTPVLEQPLPPVLSQLVSEFSRHLKEQTSTGDEIDKSSDSGMKKVRQEMAAQRQVRERGEVCGMCDVRCLSGLLQAVGDVSAQIQRDAQRVGYLKQENTEVCVCPSSQGWSPAPVMAISPPLQELSHAEIAQRTHELPAALQHENIAPAQ